MSNNLNYNQDPLQNLAQHMATLQKRFSELESRVETTNDRLMGLAKASKERFERFQSVISGMDFAHRKLIEDLKIELAKVSGLVTQKRVIDTKIEEILKNHSEMVSQVELRLQDLKKMYSAQGMKLTGLESKINTINLP